MRSAVRWTGLYRGQWDLISPESNVHPAKMTPGLAFRVLDHLAERGLLRPGDTVLDFMAGTGTIPIAAALRGHRAVGIELEPFFADLAAGCDCVGVDEQMFRRMARGRSGRIRSIAYSHGARVCPACQAEVQKRLSGKSRAIYLSPPHRYVGNVERLVLKTGLSLDVTIIQGDAREMDRLLGERGLIGVVSPPYLEAQRGGGIAKRGYLDTGDMVADRSGYKASEHGSTPGQIGALPDRPRVAGIVSPPYGETERLVPGHATPEETVKRLYMEGKPREAEAVRKHASGPYSDLRLSGYGASPGQIGALPDRPRIAAVVSPPYEDSDNRGRRIVSPLAWRQMGQGGVEPLSEMPTAPVLGRSARNGASLSFRPCPRCSGRRRRSVTYW